MKKIKTFSLLLVVLCLIPILTGCKKKSSEITYDGEKIKINFVTKKGSNYKISTDNKDLRTSRENAIILADNFKIGIEENDDLTFPQYFGDFEKLKADNTDEEEYKEVTYSDIKGFEKYYGSYVRFEVYLPIDKKTILKLNIYSIDDTEESTKKVFKSDEIKELLNNMTITKK